MVWLTEFNVNADADNFIVVYPEALVYRDLRQWNNFVDAVPGHAGLEEPDAPSDVDFTRDIIDYMSANYAIDTRRVYATGFSSGGMMCYALAMLLSDRIAAIAPVAGTIWGDTAFVMQRVASGSVRPIPVMHVHGTADNDVPYPDPDNRPDPYQEWPLYVVAAASGATTYSDVTPLMPGVDRLTFSTSPVDVSLVRIIGMAHDWDNLWNNGTYQTSNEIVKFFGLERGVSGVERPAEARTGTIAPRLVDGSLRLELSERATVQIISPLGSIVYSAEHAAGSAIVPCGDLPAGLYLARVLSADAQSTVAQGAVIVR
jgi:dienelactone hydrolase